MVGLLHSSAFSNDRTGEHSGYKALVWRLVKNNG